MYGTTSSAGDHDEAVVSAQTLGPTPLEMPEYFPLSLSSGEGPGGLVQYMLPTVFQGQSLWSVSSGSEISSTPGTEQGILIFY